jgi:hypothetical protein
MLENPLCIVRCDDEPTRGSYLALVQCRRGVPPLTSFLLDIAVISLSHVIVMIQSACYN